MVEEDIVVKNVEMIKSCLILILILEVGRKIDRISSRNSKIYIFHMAVIR